MILGTAAYMGPEQAKGRTRDKRSDIWAFGCRALRDAHRPAAFDGEDITDMLAGVLRASRTGRALPADTAAADRTLLRRCLQKDPQEAAARHRRRRASRSMTLSTPRPAEPPREDHAPVKPQGWTTRALPFLLVAAVVCAVTWLARLTTLQKPRGRRADRPRDSPSNSGDGQNFTANTGRNTVAIAPDGSKYRVRRQLSGILRSPSEAHREAHRRDFPEGVTVTSPVFSPDGLSLAFYLMNNALQAHQRERRRGRHALPRHEVLSALSWKEDGLVFGQGPQGILRVSPNGGTARGSRGREGRRGRSDGPHILPGGKAVLFSLATTVRNRSAGQGADCRAAAGNEAIVRCSSRGEARCEVSFRRAISSTQWVAIYTRSGSIRSASNSRVDQLRSSRASSAQPAVRPSARQRHPCRSVENGHAGLRSRPHIGGGDFIGSADLALADQQRHRRALEAPPGDVRAPAGVAGRHARRLRYRRWKGGERLDLRLVWRSAPRRITLTGKNRFPSGLPDGQRVAFQSDREGDVGIFWQRADGTARRSGSPKQTGTVHVPDSWSPRDDVAVVQRRPGSSFVPVDVVDGRTERGRPWRRQGVAPILPRSHATGAGWRTGVFAGTTAGHRVGPALPATGANIRSRKRRLSFALVAGRQGAVVLPFLSPVCRSDEMTRPNFTFGNPVAVPRRSSRIIPALRGNTTSCQMASSSAWSLPGIPIRHIAAPDSGRFELDGRAEAR